MTRARSNRSRTTSAFVFLNDAHAREDRFAALIPDARRDAHSPPLGDQIGHFGRCRQRVADEDRQPEVDRLFDVDPADRKSTRLNSSHLAISYAVFCLK